MADETEGKPDAAKPPEQEMREKTEKFGAGYAIMSDAFKGKGVTMAARLTSWFLAAAAIGVIVMAVLSKLF